MSVFKRKGMAFCVLAALGAECVLLLLFMAVCAFLIGRELLPVEQMNLYCILCVFLSIFPVCATISGARGEKHLPFCLLSGGGECVILLLSAAGINGLEPYGAWTLRVFGAAFSAALAAAFLQIRQNDAQKRRRKRR